MMRFFLERGADIRRPDAFGVTPLHVAAALDYEDMIHFLLETGGAFVLNESVRNIYDGAMVQWLASFRLRKRV